jgi:hypothetical protein
VIVWERGATLWVWPNDLSPIMIRNISASLFNNIQTSDMAYAIFPVQGSGCSCFRIVSLVTHTCDFFLYPLAVVLLVRLSLQLLPNLLREHKELLMRAVCYGEYGFYVIQNIRRGHVGTIALLISKFFVLICSLFLSCHLQKGC